MSSPEAIAAAYSHCETVTRAEAANFYYGIRLLPGARRRAICAVYAFARRVDDIGDGDLPREEKLRRLQAEQVALDSVETGGRDLAGDGGGPGDPVMIALSDAYRSFPLPRGALGELIEGVRMDVRGETYEHFEDLVVYCQRVAGAIGRVCLAIFGLRKERGVDRVRAEQLADDLGVALQLTNILRDVREDALNGRVYLPAEDLRRFGLLEQGVEAPAPELLASLEGGAGTAALVAFEADRARGWFERGMGLTELLDRRSAASVRAMAGIYRRLLERIASDPREAAGRRISLPAREKAWVAVRSMLGGGG